MCLGSPHVFLPTVDAARYMPLVASMEGRGEDTPEEQAGPSADQPAPSAGEPTPPPPDEPEPEEIPPVAEGESAAPEPAAQPQSRDDRRGWLVAGLVLLAAAVIGVVIGTSLGGQGGPLSNQPAGNGRPTIVVGNGAPSPSPLVAASPSPLPATQIAGGTATTVPGSTEY